MMKYTNVVKLSFVVGLLFALSACVPQFAVDLNVQGVEDGASYADSIPDIGVDYSESYQNALAEDKEELFINYVSNELNITLNAVNVTAAFDIKAEQAVLIDPSVVNAALIEGNNILQVNLTPDPDNIFVNILTEKTTVNFAFLAGSIVPNFAVRSVTEENGQVEIIGYVTDPMYVRAFILNGVVVPFDADTGEFTAVLDQTNRYNFETVDIKGIVSQKIYNKNIKQQVTIRSSIKDTLIDQTAVRDLIRENVKGTFYLSPALLNEVNPLVGFSILGFGGQANVVTPLTIGQANLNSFDWGEGGTSTGRVNLNLTMLDLIMNVQTRLLLGFFHVDIGIRVFISTVTANVWASFGQQNGELEVDLDDLRVSNLTGVRVVVSGFIPIGFDFITGGLINFFTRQENLVNLIVGLIEPRINSMLDDLLGGIVLGLSVDTPIADLTTAVTGLSTSGGKLFADLSTKVTPGTNVKPSLGVLKSQNNLSRPALNTDFGVNISQTLINQVLHALHVSGVTDATVYLNNPLEDLLFISEQETNAGDWRVNVQTSLPLEVLMQQQNKAGVNLPGMIMGVDVMNSEGEWMPVLSYLLSLTGAADISLSSNGFLSLDVDEDSINFNVVNVELLGEEVPFINAITQAVLTVIKPVVNTVLGDLGAVEFQLPLDNPFVDLNNLTYSTGDGKIVIGSNIDL